MKKILLTILGISIAVLLFGATALADPTSNPVFATIEGVKQMIADAVGQPIVLPPFTSTVEEAQVYPFDGEIIISVDLESKFEGGEEFGALVDRPTGGDVWGIAHLPGGDKYTAGNLDSIWWRLSSSEFSSFTAPVELDLYVSFSGKTVHLTTEAQWQ